jgi:hypothetical protein
MLVVFYQDKPHMRIHVIAFVGSPARQGGIVQKVDKTPPLKQKKLVH